ncbi:hypothetical protein Tco_0940121 [Tanacetum coccineum]|uniref:Retrotransposon gag domain-containing protein n=1 Tax=Tanacetum coccineum TaxID=301880 RepID=A0ABQ5DM23_9ASTR
MAQSEPQGQTSHTTPNANTTTTVTEAHFSLIDQGVAAAMAEAEASRVRNGYNSNDHYPTAAHACHWATLKKIMTDKYCPRGEIKKIKTEMWNLKVKGTDVVAYSRRFQQPSLSVSGMFPEEIDIRIG